MTIRTLAVWVSIALASTMVLSGVATPTDPSPIIMERMELEESPAVIYCKFESWPEDDPEASGGRVMTMEEWCDMQVPAFTTSDSWRAKNLRLAIAGLPGDIPEDTRVMIELTHVVGQAHYQLEQQSIPAPFGNESFFELDVSVSKSLKAGTYSDIRISAYGFRPVEGTIHLELVPLNDTRFRVDYLEIGCGNVAVRTTPTPELGGFGPDRDLFWTDSAYDLRASIDDPEDDPVSFSWDIGFDRHVGLPFTYAFEDEGTETLRLYAYDHPEARCPDAMRDGAFLLIMDLNAYEPDWVAQITSPRPDESCIMGSSHSMVAGHRVFAGECVLRAAVDTLDMPRDLIGGATYRLDGVAFAEATAAPDFEVTLDATDHLPGEHVLDVCFFAVNDEKRGLNCSPGERILIL